MTRDVQPSVASDVKEFLRNSIGATFTEVKDIELRSELDIICQSKFISLKIFYRAFN